MARQQTWQELLAQKNQEVAILRSRFNELTQRLVAIKPHIVAQATKGQELSNALDEYEKTISMLYAEKEDVEQQIQRRVAEIARERDELQEDLKTQQFIYADIDKKFQKCAEILRELRKEEDDLKNQFERRVKVIEDRNLHYTQLGDYRDREQQSAKLEMEAVRCAHDAEMARVQVQMRAAEAELKDLERTIALKEKENEELLEMCDQLIAHHGSDARR